MTCLTGCSKSDDDITPNGPHDEGNNGDLVTINSEIPYPVVLDYDPEYEPNWEGGDQLKMYLTPKSGEDIEFDITNVNGYWNMNKSDFAKYQSALKAGGKGCVVFFGKRMRNGNFSAEIPDPTCKFINYLTMYRSFSYTYKSKKNEACVELSYSDEDWAALTYEEIKVLPDVEWHLQTTGYNSNCLKSLQYDAKNAQIVPSYKIEAPDLTNAEIVNNEGSCFKYLYVKSCVRANDLAIDNEIGGKKDFKKRATDNLSIDVQGYTYKSKHVWYASVIGFNNSNKEFIKAKEGSLNHNQYEFVNLEQSGIKDSQERANFVHNYAEFVLWFSEVHDLPLRDFMEWLDANNLEPKSSEEVLARYAEWCKSVGLPPFVRTSFEPFHFSHEKMGENLTPSGINKKSWMSMLDPRTPVWKLYVPGCHDAATSTLLDMPHAKCQEWSVSESFDLGARCFDLRVGTDVYLVNAYFKHFVTLWEVGRYIDNEMFSKDDLGQETVFFEVDTDNGLKWAIEKMDTEMKEYAIKELIVALAEKYGTGKDSKDFLAAFVPETPIGELRGKICLIVHDEEFSDWLYQNGYPHVYCHTEKTSAANAYSYYNDKRLNHMAWVSFPYFNYGEFSLDDTDKWPSIIKGVDSYEDYLTTATSTPFVFFNCNSNAEDPGDAVGDLSKYPARIAEYINPLVTKNFLQTKDAALKNGSLGRHPAFWGFDFYGVERTASWLFIPVTTGGHLLPSLVPYANFFYYDNTGHKAWNVQYW